MTKSVGVNPNLKYYVDHAFDRRYARDTRALAQVEHAVEAQTFKLAEEQCAKQKSAKYTREHSPDVLANVICQAKHCSTKRVPHTCRFLSVVLSFAFQTFVCRRGAQSAQGSSW
jgi:hypothetical protein